MASAAQPLGKPHVQVTAGHGLAVAGTTLGAVAAAGVYALALPLRFVLISAAAFGAIAGCTLVLARSRMRGAPFGTANVVTLLRAALAAPLAGLALEAPDAGLAWFAIALAVTGLVLDGVDGRLARGAGLATPFGARFDMEVDALLILGLSVLCWQFEKAGAWILAAGLLRYAFVAAARALPWMRRPLPPSRRRQTVCVVQVVALLACLSPLLDRGASAAVGALGLAVLAWSFAVDVVHLARSA